MSDILIRIPKRHRENYLRAREKLTKLRRQGIEVSLFDLMMEEGKENKELQQLYKGFKL